MRKMMVLLLLCMFACVALADVAPSGFSTSPATLKPGVSGSLSFTLTNTGIYSISGVDLYPSGYRLQFFSDKISVGSMGPGASTVVTVPFKVEDAAAAGVYNIELSAYWVDPVGGSARKTFSVPVTVSSAVAFQISSITFNSTQIHAGDAFTVNAVITNTGGAARNARLSSGSANFPFAGSSQITLGDLSTAQNTPVTIPFSADSRLTPGLYSIPLTVTYEDELGAAQSASLSIGPVTIYRSAAFFNITARPAAAHVLPGQRARVEVNVTNVGAEAARFVKIALVSNTSTFVPVDSSDKYVESIAPGETKGVSFDVGVNTGTPPGFYPLLVTITYSDPRGAEQPQVRQITGIEVAGVSALDVIASASPGPVTAGRKHTLSLQVSNVGTFQLKSVRVSVSSSSFDILVAPDAYIGTLNVDDYSTVTYPIYTHADLEPGRHPFIATITYRDSDNVERTMAKNVYIDVVSAETAARATGATGGMDFWFLAFAGLIVLLVAYFVVYKRFIAKRR